MAESLSRFTRAMARDSAPASGSAAAMAAAMAAALAQKVAARSGQLPGAAEISERAETLRVRALELVDADQRAVREMLASGEPGPDAILVPQQIGALAAELASIAGELQRNGEPRLLADSVGAGDLARAAEAMSAAIIRSNTRQEPLEPPS